MFWPLSKFWHFPHKIHFARIYTLTYVLHIVSQENSCNYNLYHDSAESGSGHLIVVDGRLSLICILLVSVDDNVHFDGFAASAGGRDSS